MYNHVTYIYKKSEPGALQKTNLQESKSGISKELLELIHIQYEVVYSKDSRLWLT